MLQFGIMHWYWLIDRHSLETLLKAYQVLLAHFDLLILHETTPNLHWFWNLAVGSLLSGLGSPLDRAPNQQKCIISRKFINNFEVGWHLGKFVFGSSKSVFNF